MKGETGKFGPYFKDVVVQYWVNFEDGTSFISPVYPITVQTTKSTSSWQECEKARATLIEPAALLGKHRSRRSLWDDPTSFPRKILPEVCP
jgi:hypothetical protein